MRAALVLTASSRWVCPVFGLAILLIGGGCSRTSPVVPGPSDVSIQGAWRGLDTLAYTVETDQASGDETAYRVLHRHLTATDSVWTELSVVQSPEGTLDGFRVTSAYQIRGDSIRAFPQEEASSWRAVSIRGDTLTIQGEGFLTADEIQWVRAEPLSVPPDLLGLWVGLSPPDAAGVPAEFGFRFRADGIYENGWGDANGRFMVLGPYVLLEESPLPPDVIVENAGISMFMALRVELQVDGPGPDRLVFLGDPRSGEPPLVMIRR